MVIEDRHFWRRGIAFAIDLILLILILAVLAGASNKAFGTRLVAMGGLNISNCQPANFFSTEQMKTIFPLEENGAYVQTRCDISSFLITPYSIARVGVRWNAGNVTHSRWVSFPVDGAGNPAPIFNIEIMIYILGPLLFACLLSRRRATLGKSIMSLSVVDDRRQLPTYRRALFREMVKFSPGFLFASYTLVSQMLIFGHLLADAAPDRKAIDFARSLATAQQFSWFSFIVPAVFTIAFVWFFFGSFMRWRGQTYWDRFARLYVVRAGWDPHVDKKMQAADNSKWGL